MTDEPSQVDPALLAQIERLADQMAAQGGGGDLARRLEMIVDLLIARGHLMPSHKRLLAKIRDDRAQVRLATFSDKRSVESPDVDCAALFPLCHGRCCTFALSLSAEDLREGKLRWDLLEPYMLPKADSGYCVHHDPASGCTVYEERPATCRVYDCRDDRRVWIDYEKRIPAPMPEGIVPPGGSK